VVVVEAKKSALAVPDLEEAHDPSGVVAVLLVGLAALHGGSDSLGHDR
jgi:nitrate reductase NapAB chaperone NapD